MGEQLKFHTPDEKAERTEVFAEVLLPLPMPGTYTYKLPSHVVGTVAPGQRVAVQFGKRKLYSGLVVSLHGNKPSVPAKLVLEVLDEEPILRHEHVAFWHWVAEYYCCTPGEVMAAALPSHLKLASETQVYLHPDRPQNMDGLQRDEYEMIEVLELQQPQTIDTLAEAAKSKAPLKAIRELYNRGFVMLHEELQETYSAKKEVYVEHVFDVAEAAQVMEQLKKAPKQADIVLYYLDYRKKHDAPLSRKELLKASRSTSAALNSLVEKGVFRLTDAQVSRIGHRPALQQQLVLSQAQQQAAEEIETSLEGKDVVLLHGVTGSGKTHVYMKMIDLALAQGKQALYLLPEIALTAQLIARLQDYYGDKIGIYHSRFNASERMEIWQKVAKGDYQIVLGVRSALFLPFARLGLLVIDEEHEYTFKQFDPAPRYHTRDAGIYLMSMLGGKTILGTATPSLESYFNAVRGKYGLVKLTTRFSEIKMPEIVLADTRIERRDKKMKGHFTGTLMEAMQATLDDGGQVILFQNRRGFAPVLECTNCGWTPVCINCDISLTYHQAAREILCHYCGYREHVPGACKACSHSPLKMLGFGTEKIEEELGIYFPQYNTVRMDQDTTRQKNAYNRIIGSIENNEAQILVGTQMVTKGLDFDRVRLVGILNADQMLRHPDFRAIERSYQLMSQVSGRAGRRQFRGKVVIQTSAPQHAVFAHLIAHDYEGFYHNEIEQRMQFKYPPFYKMVRIVVRHVEREPLNDLANRLGNNLRDYFGIRVLGPEAPPVGRVRNYYLKHIILRFERRGLDVAEAKKQMMDVIAGFKNLKEARQLKIHVDVDPY